MLDIGWSEMAVVLVVALIVIGPKDLPKLAREIGRWTSKARSMAREFQRSLDDMAREADLQDLKQGFDKVSRTNLTDTIRQTIDPDRALEKAMDVDMGLPTGSVMSPPPPPPAVEPPPSPPTPAVADAGTPQLASPPESQPVSKS